MIDTNDPGGQEFYPDIVSTFERMEEEEKTPSNTSNSECLSTVDGAVESYGTMAVLVCLASILADKSNNCRHYEWLSSNFNVLVNRASEHNTDQYKFPFGT